MVRTNVFCVTVFRWVPDFPRSGFSGSWVPGFLGSWILGFLGSWIPWVPWVLGVLGAFEIFEIFDFYDACQCLGLPDLRNL